MDAPIKSNETPANQTKRFTFSLENKTTKTVATRTTTPETHTIIESSQNIPARNKSKQTGPGDNHKN